MDIFDQSSSNQFNQDNKLVNSYDTLSLFQKNEEYKFKIISLESKIHSMTVELKQNESWKERYIEQKNQLSKMNQTIEDLQTRLKISLQSCSELEKKHQEEMDQINSQRMSETIFMKTNFSKKENQQNEIISNLKEEIKSLKAEIGDYNQKLIDLQKKSSLEKDSNKDQSFVPFSIQIPTTDLELKWKGLYKKEKEKKKKLKNLQLQQSKLIDEKQQKIEYLEKEIDEKQNIIDSIQQQQQTETSAIIQSLQQKIDDFQSQNSFSFQESQKKLIQQSNNNMELELASFFSEQNEIHNKKINSLSIKLSKSIQIINNIKEQNEKLSAHNHQLKEKIKQISFIQNDLNSALFENQEKEQIIKKMAKKISQLRSKNKNLKKLLNDQNRSQNLGESESEVQNNSQVFFDKFLSMFDNHKNEINSMIQSNSSSQVIPTNLLPPELLSDLSNNEITIERIIEWYNKKINFLRSSSKQLKIMKNVISSCFTNVQFNIDNNKVFCEQVRDEINSLKDNLREMTLKQQQMHLNTIVISDKENT